MIVEYEMNDEDALVLHYGILVSLTVDSPVPPEDGEKLAAIGKACFAYAIGFDENKPRSNLGVGIESALLPRILNGVEVLWLNVDAAAHLHVNVNARIPGTPYLFRNLGDLLPAMQRNKKRIKAMLLQP